jgi:xanthine dehydrogenase accessory factor
LTTHELSRTESDLLPVDLDYAACEDAPLRAALAWARAGEPFALVTIVGVEGASPRPLGAQMAVTASGDWVGYISGGCLESAVAREAQAALAAGESRVERYGRGSRYFDIVLPCGSGIDLLIDVAPDLAALAKTADALDRREPATLTLTLPDGARFERRYVPALKIIAAGRGPAVAALLDLAAAMGLKTAALSPDESVAALARGRWEEARALTHPEDIVDLGGDAYSAVVLLFHDHHWETELLTSALKGDCFYIGAMGSRATHAQRVVRLAERGLDDDEIGRVRGPIGLFPGARRPGDLALSVLAEIVGEFRERYGA